MKRLANTFAYQENDRWRIANKRADGRTMIFLDTALLDSSYENIVGLQLLGGTYESLGDELKMGTYKNEGWSLLYKMQTLSNGDAIYQCPEYERLENFRIQLPKGQSDIWGVKFPDVLLFNVI